jgi:hypothetical protein
MTEREAMYRTIGTALGHPTPNHDRQPVRRHSCMAGRCEGTFWRRTDRQEARRIVLAARRYDLAERAPGRRNGPLGHIGIEVIELLAHLIDRRTGRLEPSLTWLMEKLRRSRDAVVRALAALRAHGFLDWLRRYEPTGLEGCGPQIRQTSNAYRLFLPLRAARLLPSPPPLPDEVIQAQTDREAEIFALSVEDLVTTRITDPWLGRLLAQMARRVPKEDPKGTGGNLASKRTI